ncbi:MAG: hypothetical protein J6V44_15715 [Methanobrevibacter sp.]|nr:hypothetical protein [Methanobrevibacter sp.]MBO7692150.1 hypothetical protein [Methanobrevibacter sp.]
MLVDKNVSLLDELIQVSETAIDAHRYIDQLEQEIAELKSNPDLVSKDKNQYITTLPHIITTIYRPSYNYVKSNQKCNKCKDGFIKVEDSFYTRTKICDCQKKVLNYFVQELSAISVSCIVNKEETVTYDCIPKGSNDTIISVNRKYIYNSFNKKHLSLDIGNVFYTNKEDCEEFCRRKNK